jgi:homeobox protein cut-like
VQILHAELEASLQAVTEDLANTRADLEKEKVLNERLEMDLIQVNQHLPKSNGDRISGASSPLGLNNASQDGLSDLNLGHKAQVRCTSLAVSYS